MGKLVSNSFILLSLFFLSSTVHVLAQKKAWEKEQINEKWAETTWAKKIEQRKKRAGLTDFDRFKLMKAKQARNKLITIQFGRLRKAAKSKAPKAKRINKKPHNK